MFYITTILKQKHSKMDHHKINEETKVSIDLKKHEARKRKFAPKTKAQRLKGTFYILSAVWLLCQFCSAALASTGVLHYAATKFNNNGFLIVSFAVVVLVFLEFSFNKLNQDLHSQLHDDKEGINPITCILIAVFGLFYVGSTFVGTPYAVKFFAASPSYNNIKKIEAHHNNRIKEDTTTASKRIAEASKVAGSFLVSHGKNDIKSGNWRIRSNYAKSLNNRIAIVDTLQAAKDILLLKLVAAKEAQLKEAQEQNKDMKSKHFAWCNSFGQNLSFFSIFFVLCFLLSFAWCSWFVRFEMEENESILKESDKRTKEPFQEPQKKKKKEKKKNFTLEAEEVKEKNIQTIFASKKKEGDIVKENNKEFILCKMKKGKNKGKLVKKSKAQFKNLMNSQSNFETIEAMKKLLQNFS